MINRANQIVPWIKSIAVAILMGAGVTTCAAELKWIEPFEAAKQEAKQAGKPMLVFIGNTDACKDCQAFVKSVCTQILHGTQDSKDESWKKSRINEAFNIPNVHAVIIAKSVPEGRMKYCEVGMMDKTFTPEKTYTSAPPKFSPEPLKGRYLDFMTSVVGTQGWETTLDLINQKESRPQDKPKPFAELPAEEQAKILKWYPELKDLNH